MDFRPPPTHLPRRSLLVETLLVLGVSLGASAIWSILSLARKLTAPGGLAAQTTSMNTSRAPDQPWIDLAYQHVGIGLALVQAVCSRGGGRVTVTQGDHGAVFTASLGGVPAQEER